MSIVTLKCTTETCNGVVLFDQQLMIKFNLKTIEGQKAFSQGKCTVCQKEHLVVPSFQLIATPKADSYLLVTSKYYGTNSHKIYNEQEAFELFDHWCESVYDDNNLYYRGFSETITLWKVDAVTNEKVSLSEKTIKHED